MVVAPLDRKLLRELWRMRGQVITIALVVSCGVGAYVSLGAVGDSTSASKERYYRDARFADAFDTVQRAPEGVADRLRAIDGVGAVETRIVQSVLLDVAGMNEPATARVLSVPADREPLLNRLYLRRGRWLDPAHSDEVLVGEPFANAHGLDPGDSLVGLLNGRRERLRVVGVVLSPEFVYSLPPGELTPNDRRFAVLWMSRSTLAAAWQMEGQFNDVSLALARGASLPAVLAAVDRTLEPYGALGAYGRDHQTSERFVESKLKSVKAMASTLPIIFLLVAAFLVNVVLARTISAQREQLAALKALGFTNLEIAAHYVKFVLAITLLGAAVGVAWGGYAGQALAALYARYFRFPVLDYSVGGRSAATAILLSVGTALVGTLGVIRRAAKLPPAEAMRPEAPPTYAPSLLERTGFYALFSQAARMVLRDMERRPMRTLLAVLGIAFATSIMVAGRFSMDGIEYLTDVQFHMAQREDLTLTVANVTERRAVREVASLPGVLRAEGMLSVPVRLHHGHLVREAAVQGLQPESVLRRVIDAERRPHPLPARGLLLSRVLAERLAVRVGDAVDVEILIGDRATRRTLVLGVVDDFMGLGAYMTLDGARSLLGEEGAVSQVLLTVDPAQQARVYEALKHLPRVAGLTRRDQMIQYFREQSADTMIAMTAILAIIASVIAVAVVYNSARIALALRQRELASLRVLGFTRAEVAAIIVGEQMAQVLLAIPLGLLLGRGLAGLAMRGVDPELFRLPMVISPRTYASAALVTLCAGLASALLVRRQVDRLDMIAVLKARD